MKQARFSEEQVIGILKTAEAMGNIHEACKEHSITELTCAVLNPETTHLYLGH